MDPSGCTPCEDLNCARCRTFGKRNCLNCMTGYVERGNECFPQASFGNSFTLNDKYKAVPCHPACLTCSGPRSTQCLTCAAGKILYAFQYKYTQSYIYFLYFYRYYQPNNGSGVNLLNWYETYNYVTCDDFTGSVCKPGYTLGTTLIQTVTPAGTSG